MTDEPYIPFYKPDGMSDEQYTMELSEAHAKHAEWEREQMMQSCKCKQYENLLIRIAETVKCLPDFATPETGNEHIIKAITKRCNDE